MNFSIAQIIARLLAPRHEISFSWFLWQRLCARLRERGWFTSVTTEPPALHLMLSPFHAEAADVYLADLAWALEAVRASAPIAQAEARY